MKRRFFVAMPAALLAAVFAAAIYLRSMLLPPDRNSAGQEPVRVEIPRGMTVRQAGALLESLGLVRDGEFFYLAVKFPAAVRLLFPSTALQEPFVLKSGVYMLDTGMSVPEMMAVLSSGAQEYIVVRLPEGLTLSKIGRILDDSGVCPAGEFMAAASDGELLGIYGIPGTTFEGYLFPDTYYMNPETPADETVRTMADNFFSRIKGIPELSGMTPERLHRTVILASIVEREYRVPSEAPLIASVFTNRLRDGIGLYSCATVEYIITEIQGRPHPERILIEDTRTDNPYNTYRWAGLPPGPISNPGLTALSAAAAPPETDYYFFQVSDPDAGTHVFSRTFSQHRSNHSLYTKKAP